MRAWSESSMPLILHEGKDDPEKQTVIMLTSLALCSSGFTQRKSNKSRIFLAARTTLGLKQKSWK